MALEGWPQQAGAERSQRILEAVRTGNYQLEWCPLVLGDLHLVVSCDALKIDGVRVSADAVTQQRVADELDSVLLTPKLYDAIWLNTAAGNRLDPKPQPITSSTAGTVQYSARVDSEVARRGAAGLLANVGKAWVMTNAIFTQAARDRKRAANYGWIVPASETRIDAATGRREWREIPVEQSASTPSLWIIQDIGTSHDDAHDDYCLAPDTRVLTADLRWIPIEHVAVGTELIGFPEDLGGRSKLCSSIVTSKTFVELECFAVVTDQGTIYASADHRWVTTSLKPAKFYKNPKERERHGRTKTRKHWVRTIDLVSGMYLTKYCEPWDFDTSWDGGWMAGFLDGEGWVSDHAVGFGQNPGFLLERACALLERDGFVLGRLPNRNGCVRVSISGGVPMRVLGRYRPYRLMKKSRVLWEGYVPWGGRGRNSNARVLEVVPVGKRELVGLGTTTKTLIAEGFLTHNSQVMLFARRAARFGELPIDLADVYTGRAPGNSLVSHEGFLSDYRQPDVPEEEPEPPVPEPPLPVPVPGPGTAIAPAPARGGMAVPVVTGAVGAGIGYAAGGTGAWGFAGALIGGIIGLLARKR